MAATLAAGGPALAQDMGHMAGMHDMPGMAMPMARPPKPKPKPKHPAPPARRPAAAPAPAAQPVAAMPAMRDMEGHDVAGHAMAMPGMAMPAADAPGTPPAGDAPPPAPPTRYWADGDYGSAAMTRARHRMMAEQGGQTLYRLLFNLAEYQARAGRDGYRWDAEAWIGGDIDRLAIRSEGEGSTRGRADRAELQALWSHAVGAYTDLQGGVRQDVGAGPKRTYLTIAAETLALYNLDGEARLFLSTRGEVLARLEGWYDQRITQRLVLQPRAELNFAAQTSRATGIGRGLSDAELGLRLRYEIRRKLAPYVGVSYEAETGRTARYTRDTGRDPTGTSYVAGVRFWF